MLQNVFALLSLKIVLALTNDVIYVLIKIEDTKFMIIAFNDKLHNLLKSYDVTKICYIESSI